MKVSDAIRTKRAVRSFADKSLSEDAIQVILNAGRRAQSSKNTQPWQFITITDKPTLKSLSQLGNWAGHLAGAALGVAIVHSNPVERFQILFDIGQSAAYMQLAAWEIGIASCLATIYDQDSARRLLAIPAEMHMHFAISFGYPQNPDDLSRPPQMGGRKPATELIHRERW